MMNWTHGISSTYWVSLLQTSYQSHDYGSFSNISSMGLGGSGYRQIPFCLCVKDILIMKIHVVGACLCLAGCLFHCVLLTD
jgi:hypothetical protein